MFKRISIGFFANTLLVAGLISCNSSSLKNQETQIEVGKNYIFSLDWENKDPFEKVEIDTVKVVDIKGEYIQWEYKNGVRLSGKLKYFKHRQKPCN